MRVGIVGAGSIGSLFAGCLSKTTCDILLYGRGLHAAHLTADGLQIEGLVDQKIPSNRWEVLLEEQPIPDTIQSSCDVVLMCGKASAFDHHLKVAQHILRNDGYVCTLSNGLGHEEKLVHAFGAHRVLASTTTHGAYRPQAGVVHWAGSGHVTIGPFMHSHTEASFRSFMELLSDADLRPRWEEDGRVMLWNKMLLNIAINPLAGLLGKENGALMEPALFETSVSVMLEGARIARAEGVSIEDDESLVNRLRDVLQKTGNNYCSMLQDIRAGRETEIHSLNAEVCRRGEILGIPTPLNQLLASVIAHLR